MRDVLCPCCGQPIPHGRVPVEALREVPVSRSQKRVLDALVEAWPRRVTLEALVEAVYFDDPDCGPEWATNVVAGMVARLRVKLPAYGWSLPVQRAGRGCIATYKLEPLETGAQ